MTPEDFSYFRQRVTRFISGTSLGSKSRSFGAPNIRRISLIPKRSLPQQLAERLKVSSSGDDGIATSQRDVSSLGKITLNLEQTRNNLEKILQVISEDYKNTQDQNRKETEEYRKRIANRGRIFGKKELGDSKVDILGAVKKYTGSFFSGAGGAIRGLAMFNLLQGLLSGDPSKIIGPLLGIGATYIPAIIGGIATTLTSKLVKSLFSRGGGAAASAAGAAGGAAAGASRLGGLGKFAGKAALVGGGLALASSLFGKKEDQNTTQQRLEELTQEQKALTQPSGLVPLPQNDLKRFEDLNKKFEAALDFLIKKQGEGRSSQGQSGGAQSPGPTPQGSPSPGNFSGTSGSEQAMNYFMSQGMTKEQASGIVANLMQESTAALDPMARNATGHRGIAQWDSNRWSRFERWASANGLDVNTREAQLQWIMEEMNSGSGGLGIQRYKQTRTAEEAAALFLSDFERSGERPGSVGYENRIRNARALLAGSQTSLTSTSLPPTPRAAAPRRLPSPSSQQPSFVLAPMPVGGTSGSPQASATAAVNDTVPEIDTSYSDNFLTMYSKLVYQIV